MTPPPDVLVVGAEAVAADLRAAGITDITVLSGDDITDSVFDDGTDTWELHTTSGETLRAAVVIRRTSPTTHGYQS